MNTEKIGLFIKELRNEKKLTQKELAEKLSITVQAVSKWERGKGLPDISYLEDLSKIFEVSIHELLKGERTDKVDENDIVYSIKYGKETTKKKILRISNITIKTIVLLVCVYLLIGNLINFHYGKKEYVNPYNQYDIYITKENKTLIEQIKKDKGKYSDEDYKIILDNLILIEDYNDIVEKRIQKETVNYKDMHKSFYLSDSLLEIVFKYKVPKYEDLKKYYFMSKFSFRDQENFHKKFGENLYLYQIDKDYYNYLDEKQLSDTFIIESFNIILKNIIEAGEINE